MPANSSEDSATISSCFEPAAFFDRIFVLYASQTGQAESISEYLFDNLRSLLTAVPADNIERHCLSNYEQLLDTALKPLSDSKQSYLAIFVVSTTGQGDSPDKVLKFFRWIRRLARGCQKDTQPKPLEHLWYSLLGLGDTNYDNFANFGHVLDKLLLTLGARSYFPTAYADDAVGLELTTEPYIENLSEHLLKHSQSLSSTMAADKAEMESIVAKTSNIDLDADKSALNCQTLEKECRCDCCGLTVDSEIRQKFTKPSSLKEDELTLPNIFFRGIKIPHDDPEAARSVQDLVRKCKDGDGGDDCFTVVTKVKGEELGVDVHVKKVDKLLEEKSGILNPIQKAKIVLKELLTKHGPKECFHSDKVVLEAEVQYRRNKKEPEDFMPGDAYGLYTANSFFDIDCILKSTYLTDGQDMLVQDHYNEHPDIPLHVEVASASCCTDLLPYLAYGLELRTVAKKATLAHFSIYAKNETERLRLMQLSSRQGAEDYQRFVFKYKLTVCDILRSFPSCRPPLSVVLSYLSVAKPRYFSAASVPKAVRPEDLEKGDLPSGDEELKKFNIAFSVANDFINNFGRMSPSLLGHFSGKFFKHDGVNINPGLDFCYRDIEQGQEAFRARRESLKPFGDGNIDRQLLKLGTRLNALVFFRVNKDFRISIAPSVTGTPVVLIATGTGIAPFLAFCEKYSHDFETFSEKPRVALFYGCRDPDKDLTHFEFLRQYLESGSTLPGHLCLCFSRASKTLFEKWEESSNWTLCSKLAGHVDGLLEFHSDQLGNMILDENATIYACGDFRKIRPSVKKAIDKVIHDEMTKALKGSDEVDEEEIKKQADHCFAKLLDEKRLVFDVWA